MLRPQLPLAQSGYWGASWRPTPTKAFSKLEKNCDTNLVTRLKIPPPYRETGVAIPLSHCVSCGIADYRCYTPSVEMGYRSPKTDLTRGASQNKLASEAYGAIGGRRTKYRQARYSGTLRIQMEGVLRYKWSDSISLSSGLRGNESAAIHVGGLFEHRQEVSCDALLSSRGWGF